MTINTSHAGHGGTDPGAVGNGYTEAAVARLYNNEYCAITGAYNATDDIAQSVNQNLSNIVNNVNRVAAGDSWNLSWHLNAASPSATGVEVFYYGGDERARQRAAEISKTLSMIYGLPNRGAKDGSGLYVIRNTQGSTLLIELGFISNANDLKQVLDKRSEAVRAVASIMGYNVSHPSDKPVEVPEKPVKPKVEKVVPLGGIGVGTNVFATVPTNSSGNSPQGSFWITDYIEGAKAPYELSKDGKVVAYTTRPYIARVNKQPVGAIQDGSNVIVNLFSDNPDKAPSKASGYQSFWIGSYVDGNKKAPYRLIKDGKTYGYTDRNNIQLIK